MVDSDLKRRILGTATDILNGICLQMILFMPEFFELRVQKDPIRQHKLLMRCISTSARHTRSYETLRTCFTMQRYSYHNSKVPSSVKVRRVD
jgi:hypothetical protein